MDQQTKLTTFQKAVFSEVEEKIRQIRFEAEEQKKTEIQRHKDAQLVKSTGDVQKKTQEIRKKYRRETAKYSLDAKRTVLVKRMELTERIFDNTAKKILAFRNSERYTPFLLEKITAFAKMNPLPDVEILVGSEDFRSAEQIRKAYGLPCEVREDKAIQLGGFIVRDDARSIYFDETLQQKLADQKSYFIENSELYL